jgi:hypothetical protein
MKQIIRLIRRSDRGASLIETALVLPLLLLLVGGIVDFGFAFNNYITITNAAREGARYASRFPNDADGILNAAKQEATNFGVILTDDEITISPDPPGGAGTTITVTIEHDYETLLGGIIRINTITISAGTSMIVYGVPDGKDP